MKILETEVLIIGGGVVGMSASIMLSRLGVETLLYTYYPGTSPHPKSHILNQRTMEIFDELGLAEKIYAESTPSKNMRAAGWYAGIKGSHPCAGREIGRVEAWGAGREDPDYVAASPMRPGNLAQMYLEPIIKAHADEMSPGKLHFFHELLDFSQDAQGVSARIQDRETQEVFEVRARYMIAADGGKTVGPKLGIQQVGEARIMRMASIHFVADLSKYAIGEDVLTRFLINPDIGGSWTSGVMIPEGPTKWGQFSEEWVLHVQNPDQSDAPLDREAIVDLMYEVLDLERHEIERVVHVSEWVIQSIFAERFSEGRIFLAGDACKVHPPTGGLGMNSGVQEAYNLTWKLKLVLQGISDEALLQTYETERRPVAVTNTEVAMGNAMHHYKIDNAIDLSEDNSKEVNWANMARLWDPDPEHDTLREDVFKAVQAQRIGFRHHNVEIGYLYEEGALIPDGGEPYEPVDQIRIFEPSTRPGHPIPHAWISRNGEKIALGTMVAGGHFLVIAGEDGQAWIDASNEIAERTELPLRAFTLGLDEGDFLDMRGTWARLRRIDRDGVIVVRPDRFVGFHSPKMVDDPIQTLGQVFEVLAASRAT